MIRLIVAAAASIAIAMPFSSEAFAGDKDKPHVQVKPLFSQNGKSTRERASKKGPYSDIIAKYAKQFGVPVSLAHAVVRIESNFNPKARGSAGEIGLMQIKPATARMMGYSGSAKGLYDPETNIRFGMKYLAAAHELGGGETCRTILKYNAGHGAKRMNPVSKRYCGKVLALLD
jgi:Soluble lytic murein transglycosylase and related regulatory proteins (some contain LysM/invasin domains)